MPLLVLMVLAIALTPLCPSAGRRNSTPRTPEDDTQNGTHAH
ncbi:exported hypothetical protein [Paraburkholderia unamae]|nr:exported hypothetical protein [Paraburkholderia unamae]